jgi:hypothetical protein
MEEEQTSVVVLQEHKEIYSDVLADVESFYQSVCVNACSARRRG